MARRNEFFGEHATDRISAFGALPPQIGRISKLLGRLVLNHVLFLSDMAAQWVRD